MSKRTSNGVKMKKTEYTGGYTPSADEKRQELCAEKHDDYYLPEFSKEVPAASKRHETGDSIAMEYEWKETPSPSIKVKRIDFRRGEEGLADLYRVAARDGADSVCFRHNNTTYILRKTAKEIAQALYNAYGKIKGALECIVGYLRTVTGSDYVIAKVEKECWSFDKRIARSGINLIEVDNLERKNKSRLCEMITERIAELHTSNLILGRFTLNNILLGEDDLTFSDLRKLRVSRRRAYVIEEFKNILQYLFALGVASREDVYCSIAYYTAKNEESCREWYSEKTGKKADDSYDVAARIEEDVYN